MINTYLKRRSATLIFATFCTFALGFVSSITYSLIGPVFDILGRPKDDKPIAFIELMGKYIGGWMSDFLGRDSMLSSELWTVLPIVLIASALGRALLALLQWYLWEKSSEQVAADLRSDLVSAYLKVDPEQRRHLNADVDQEIGSAISTDVRMVREYLVHFYGGFPRELVQVIFYLASLLLLDWKLACIFLLGIGPAAAILSKLGKKLRKRSQAALNNSSVLLEWLQQRFTGIETIKQFQTERLEQERMEQKSNELLNNFLRAARVKARTSPLMEVVAVAAMMLVLVYALSAIASKDMSASTLLSFLVLLGVLSQSASKLGRYFNSNKEGEAALLRLQKLFRIMGDHQAEELPLPVNAATSSPLNLKNISYRYNVDGALALKDFSANFERGKIYAIAGASGSGKTTLLKLLLGLYHKGSGSVEFGIKGREELGYLPQNVQLLPASIAHNIVYPEKQFDPLKLEEALRKVGLWEFVSGQPKLWDTEIGEGGDTLLSGGQAQRLQIARLIYLAFPLLVIDEGTSALDPEIETLVLKTLRDMADRGSTIIMVAHRVAVLQLADLVYVLKRGETQFVGAPKQFLQMSDWRNYFDSNAEVLA
ncbi:MAG: ABC transporter ATP-binding protein [Bdellovibrionota bacterium]